MKLLIKSVVNTQAQELKRQQISEGTELVKRIEAMRAVLTDLQKQHRNFLDNSKEELQRETTELFGQRESLKAEVESLTAVQAELQKPLTERWNELKNAETKFNTDRERMLIEKLEFTEKENALEAMKKVMQNSLDRVKVLEYEANKNNQEAAKKNKEAEDNLKKSRTQQEETNTKIANMLKGVDIQEQALEFEKKGVAQQKKLLADKEEQLNIKELEVNAKFRTLMATIEKNGKRTSK